jgi:hypothetical protein
LERGGRGGRRALTPEVRDQTLAGNDLSDVHGEDRKHRALPLSAQLDRVDPVPDLERTQDPKLEHARFLTPFCPLH